MKYGITLEFVARSWLRLFHAIAKQRSEQTCLRRWSEFIRARDHFKCLVCDSANKISAHHICRKIYLPEARFLPGNGITLCDECHKEAHEGFNGRPGMEMPMDQQGGEKIERLAELYAALANDSVAKDYRAQAFYYMTKDVLKKYKELQGFEPRHKFAGTRIQQVATIWRSPPQGPTEAFLRANFQKGLPASTKIFRIDTEGTSIEQTAFKGTYSIVIHPRDS